MTEVVRALITKCGVSVNAPSALESSGAKPLHLAVLHGQGHLLPMLLELGADIDSIDSEKNCTPLLMSAILEDEWSFNYLLQAGANIHCHTTEGRTAMYIAAEKGNSTIIQLLIERGKVDVNASCTVEGHRGGPLHVAAMFNNAHAVWRLLECGASINSRDARDRKPIDLARETNSSSAEEMLKRQADKEAAAVAAVVLAGAAADASSTSSNASSSSSSSSIDDNVT